MYKMHVGVDRALRMLTKLSPLDIIGEVGAGKGFLFEDYSLFMSKQKKHMKKAIEKKLPMEDATFMYQDNLSQRIRDSHSSIDITEFMT